MKIVTKAIGEQRTNVLPFPTGYEIVITRTDGYAPTKIEVFTVLQIAFDSMKPKKKKRDKT